MFAVPGWSVPSSGLKPQAPELSKSTTTTTTPALSAIHSASQLVSKAGKKRKRPGGSLKPLKVNSANFPELWESVIEKRNHAGDLSRERKPTKKRSKDNGKLNYKQPAVSDGKDDIKGRVTVQSKHKSSEDDEPASKATLGSSADQSKESVIKIGSLPTMAPVPNLTPLQLLMRQKLVSARFRHLNQTLYTTPSAHSLALFQENPEMFLVYHEGFRRQVEVWPENPLEGYVADIQRRGKERGLARAKAKNLANGERARHLDLVPLPRTDGVCYVADLGCGDAGLSRGLEGLKKKLKIQVFSYDLQSPNSLVTQADIADLPLRDGSIDIAIFCLALMGTNWIDFIEEAFRVLRWKGELWITEIKSRFGRVRGQTNRVDHSIGNRKKSNEPNIKQLKYDTEEADLLVEVDGREDSKGETDVSSFVEVLRKRGFVLQNDLGVDLRNKMFVRMKFVKGQTPIKGKCVPLQKEVVNRLEKQPRGKFLDEEVPPSGEAAVLKPCVYKLR